MSHHTLKSGYTNLVDRLNRFPQGAPPSDLLHKILKMLFSEIEAQYVSKLPIKPFTIQKAARIWKMEAKNARKILDELASRAVLVDMEYHGKQLYIFPPPMAGFFEFSMMRVRSDIDQKLLSELFYQYLNVEEDFIKALFTHGETQLGRVFVHEPVISNMNTLHVLDYERASKVIKSAKTRAVSLCYCRHKMQHLNQACEAPMDICMTFNTVAASLIKHNFAREVEAAEGIDLLQTARDNNLIQFGENVRNEPSFICNCCGCCCEAMIAARRFGILNPVHTTNFIPEIDTERCNGCGKCVNVCPVEAMALVSANYPAQAKKKQAKLNEKICLGCGLCVKVCTHNTLELRYRHERIITPIDSIHRAVVMAIERGRLQNLIFDNHALMSHRALAAILGVILRLPVIKKALASKQLKSKYLEYLITRLR